MPKKYLSRFFNAIAVSTTATATLLVPYRLANIIRIELTGDAFQTGADPEVIGQVSLVPGFVSAPTFDGMLAYIVMGGTRTTDVGLTRMDFAKTYEIPNVPVAVGQSIYLGVSASACTAGIYCNVWFDVIRA
jgi:hypothetical protein